MRDLTESVRAELDSLTPLEVLVLLAAAGIAIGLAWRVHLATSWRQGFRAGRLSLDGALAHELIVEPKG